MTSRPTHRRAYGLTILNSQHKDIRRLKREGHSPEIHGNKFWNSSFLIMEHLKKRPLKTGSRVLEVGCGWGLLGIFCAKRFQSKVTGIDADAQVLPYMELHASINGVEVTGKKATFNQLTEEKLKGFDIIYGADICFWDEMSRQLFNLAKRAQKAGVKQMIVADPCRPPFTELTERCQKQFADVEVEARWIGKPVRASGELLILNLN